MASTGKPEVLLHVARLSCSFTPSGRTSVSLSLSKMRPTRGSVSKAKGRRVSQEKALGLSVRLQRVIASCLPICKLGIMRVRCENQMRPHINTLAQYVTHSKCSRNVSYNRNGRYKANITSQGQFRRALSCK